MNDKSKQTTQKLRGGYYTPIKIAAFLTSWVTSDKSIKSILEPSAGDGIFIDTLKSIEHDIKVTAIEILEEEADKIVAKTKGFSDFEIIHADFYDFYEDFRYKKLNGEINEYDAILGNPPYIRYQYLTEEQRDFQSDILENNGIKPNKLINAWMAFTVASIEMIKRGGKIGFVLPTDLLQVSYAKQLRDYLFDSLSSLTVITFNGLVFENIQQDVVLILGEKGHFKSKENSTHNLRVINLKDVEELKEDILDVPFDQYTSYSSDKWTKFYLSRGERNFYEEEFSNHMEGFNDFAKGEIGVTTGNNEFFVVNDQLVNDYKLKKYARPLLGRSVEVKGVFYRNEDLETNIVAGQKVWILDFNGQRLSNMAKKYIDYGVQNKENEGYKLSLRKRWYDIPSIWVPDAFLLRRIGSFPRIVKNEIQATSTDTFHRIKFHEKVNVSKFLFLMYSTPTLLSFELEGRLFGGGALEILPGDLKNVKLPIVDDRLDYDTLVQELDEKFRSGENITEISQWVNNKIKDHSSLSNEQIDLTFSMWQTLNRRRTKK
ncbi:Eco57I restriction-modification methylase domain-containing protein [Floricoccus penangensis]|uniref:Eco57I restriction-modification methylase domain-containing protein n=1 Tax=Floricoccus penangensis TaxID=1859475 RepID=UPI00203B9FF1|nr:N-6 DNA methylase [Floricoccus penangensis]URZ88079.1 N-6 DNA methylase [Floricoccus penangensis]